MRLLLVLLCHSPRRDVIEILKPLEIGDRDTAAIHKHVRCSDNSSSLEYLLSCICCGAIGSLKDCLDLYLLSISHVQHFFNSSRNHAISLF